MAKVSQNPLVLIHGYSDDSSSLENWKKELQANGFADIRLCNYKTLTNEITITDIAEGFDLELKKQAGIKDGEAFDTIVHSTGMLVVRAWLARYAHKRSQIKRIIGLAPATFGSPIASQGKSWMGALVKGNRELGPDFMEAGKLVLDGLELASPFTWNLAHHDLVGDQLVYGPDKDTPYVFIFCGTDSYGLVPDMVTDAEGSDGTIRWAGCAMNSVKINIDLTKRPEQAERFQIGEWKNLEIPFLPVKGLNHATILDEPSKDLVNMVCAGLIVNSKEEFEQCLSNFRDQTAPARNKLEEWQQFIIKVVDERGDPVPDYFLNLFTLDAQGNEKNISGFADDPHCYKNDPSYRCFHVNLNKLRKEKGFDYEKLTNLWLRIIAKSGTELVCYTGFDDSSAHPSGKLDEPWTARLDISKPALAASFKLFYPFTTTLVEIKLNREPNQGLKKNNQLCSIKT